MGIILLWVNKSTWIPFQTQWTVHVALHLQGTPVLSTACRRSMPRHATRTRRWQADAAVGVFRWKNMEKWRGYHEKKHGNKWNNKNCLWILHRNPHDRFLIFHDVGDVDQDLRLDRLDDNGNEKMALLPIFQWGPWGSRLIRKLMHLPAENTETWSNKD